VERSAATIVVATGRDWYGDPRLGTFTVYLDGKKAGTLPPCGRLVVSCRSGRHVVRVRQWWYLSPRLEVEASGVSPLVLDADVSRRDSLLRRLLTMMFVPWRGLSLAVAPGVSTADLHPANENAATSGRRVRAWPFAWVFAGAVVLLVGLGHHSVPIEVRGVIAAVVFEFVAIRQAVVWYRRIRRRA
jgi:hypothetical protein